MPKILIREKDYTSPGAAGSYANYAVLVAGLVKSALTADEIAKGMTLTEFNDRRTEAIDSNGIYTFTSAEDFKNVIGLVAPKVEIQYDNGSEAITTYYHYGNQMAYELLNMGYTVIYKPITDTKKIKVLGEDSFWEDLKDKSNYDFRFITHGLLESSELADEATYKAKVTRLEDVMIAIKTLEQIMATHKYPEDATTDQRTEVDNDRGAAYLAILNGEPGNVPEGFKKPTKNVTYYATFAEACEGLIGTATKVGEKTTLERELDALIAGGITTALINQANGCIANIAKYNAADADSRELPGRGDCVALIEVDEKSYTESDTMLKPEVRIINAINAMTSINADNGKFCAMTVPSVHYKMAIDELVPNVFGNNVKFPGAFHYLACFINSLSLGFAEWYAAAGYTRGVASYIIKHTSVKLGELAINALEPRNYDDPQSDYPKFACNVIANFRGSYYLWGNRTAHPLGKKGSLDTGDLVASSFLNIRQLCCTIKKQLYVACRTFTFDPNSDTLWVNFCNAIRPTLEAMKADQGIRDYKILKVFTDKKATLKAKIRIIPIEAVEDFDLEVSLEDSFGETAAVVTE